MRDHEKILLAGDTHGCIPQVDYLLDMADQQGCTALLQLGDFGYLEHIQDGVDFLNGVEILIRNSGIPIYWIDGNHDFVEWLMEMYDPEPDGTYEIRQNLFYLPRGYSWVWGSERWLALGGGNSANKDRLIEVGERQGITLWWESEAITEADVERCLSQPVADVIVSHDAPENVDVPFQFSKAGVVGLDVPPSFQQNRERVQRVVDYHNPFVLYHGHLHLRYNHRIGSGREAVEVVALAQEERWKDSWYVHHCTTGGGLW